MNTIRQEKILTFIEQNNVATTRELQALCPEVSFMTIHRDLDALEQQGMILKVRGGAKAVRHAGDIAFEERMQENKREKSAIAQKAVSLIKPYSSVFLDAGTTNLMLARRLPDMNLNIFTTSPNIAVELCSLANPVVTMCCGTLNRKNLAVSGQNTLEMLDKINIDIAFIGVSGCSAEAGFTCGTEGDMLVKRLVIRKARTSVILCDGAKFSRLMPYTFAAVEDADYVISDSPMPDSFVKAAKAAGVIVL